MGILTQNQGFYLAGGGSSGTIPDEEFDIDQQNGNWRLADLAMGVQLCTSSTRPASPKNGKLIRETDTGNTLVWSTSANRWLPIGTPRASSDSLRNALIPSPVQGDTVIRTDKGYVETYKSVYNQASNPFGGSPAGWYRQGSQLVKLTDAAAITIGTNPFTLTSAVLLMNDSMVMLSLIFVPKSGAVASTTTGNSANTTIGMLTDTNTFPNAEAALTTGSSGRGVFAFADVSGHIVWGATMPAYGADVSDGTFTVNGNWMRK